MFKISAKAKHGSIWNGRCAVKEFETDNAALAEHYKAQGCVVEEVEVTLDKLNLTQLKKYAKEKGIDLGEASTRDAILAIIEGTEDK